MAAKKIRETYRAGLRAKPQGCQFLQEEEDEGRYDTSTTKSEASIINKPAIDPGCETK
jgi:hypothetical protein